MNPDLIIGLTLAAAAVAWAWHLHRREQKVQAHIDQAIALTRPAAALETWGRDAS